MSARSDPEVAPGPPGRLGLEAVYLVLGGLFVALTVASFGGAIGVEAVDEAVRPGTWLAMRSASERAVSGPAARSPSPAPPASSTASTQTDQTASASATAGSSAPAPGPAAASSTTYGPASPPGPANASASTPGGAVPAAEASPTTGPRAGFDSGLNVVGQDVRPGRYLAADTERCYWARLSGTSGRIEEIITNDNVDGPVVVDILPTDAAFESDRCGSWVPYEPPVAPASAFGDGVYVAGEQIATGTYQAELTGFCFWARNADAAGDSIVASESAESTAVVSIEAGEVFKTSGCGVWQAV